MWRRCRGQGVSPGCEESRRYCVPGSCNIYFHQHCSLFLLECCNTYWEAEEGAGCQEEDLQGKVSLSPQEGTPGWGKKVLSLSLSGSWPSRRPEHSSEEEGKICLHSQGSGNFWKRRWRQQWRRWRWRGQAAQVR